MDLHEAWMEIRHMIKEYHRRQPTPTDSLNQHALQYQQTAVTTIDNHLDPYIKRICVMKGE